MKCKFQMLDVDWLKGKLQLIYVWFDLGQSLLAMEPTCGYRLQCCGNVSTIQKLRALLHRRVLNGTVITLGYF